MDGRSADGSSIESDRSGYFPDQASGKFSEPKSQEKSETSIFTRNRWNANGGFATRRRIDINNVNNGIYTKFWKGETMKILSMPIKKQWFDMILAGDKKEEYRAVTKFYT